ncbi:hypothetical protein [Pseudonocardia sp. NPDC046786]|uniref:hypothetical protein n=1 Tax=Pseudonocardia sp. NPDC046786 TaxID=3155471 RepID=UPI0033C16A71
MPVQLSDDDKASLIAASRNVLFTSIQAFNEYDARTGNVPEEAESPLSIFQSATRKCKGPDGFWADDFGRRLTDRVSVYLAGSRNYLGSLYAMVDGYPYGPGIAPVARCVAEACGKMAWLLDNRIGIESHARERVARLLLDEADDATRRKQIAAGLEHPDRAEMGDEYRAARDAISKPGPFWAGEIDSGDGGVITLRAQRLPKTSKFVEIAQDVLAPQDVSAKYVYGYLSSLTHPTMFAYVESLAGGGDEIFCAKLVNYATLAFHNEMRLHSGWTQKPESPLPEGDSIREKHDELNELVARLGP